MIKSNSHLSIVENELISNLIGQKCQNQCSAIAQLFKKEPPCRIHWVKKHKGVLCFVKDYTLRSYFLRMFCLERREMVWQMKTDDETEVTRVKPRVLTFKTHDDRIALSFSFEDELETFLSITKLKFNRKKLNHEKQMNKIQTNSLSQESLNRNKKLTCLDIGQPQNFQHVTHRVWKAGKGFDLTGEDAALKPFLEKAGVTVDCLKRRRTREFILDFIEMNNVEEIVMNENRKKSRDDTERSLNYDKKILRMAPPPPIRSEIENQTEIHKNRIVPSRKAPEMPSQKQSIESNGINIPPPPPLPSLLSPQIGTFLSNKSEKSLKMKEISKSTNQETNSSQSVITDDPHNALMESIRKGKNLKKVDELSTSSKSSNDSRTDLMLEIRKGIILKPTADRLLKARKLTGTDQLANALRKALELRKLAFEGDSSCETDHRDSSDESEDWMN